MTDLKGYLQSNYYKYIDGIYFSEKLKYNLNISQELNNEFFNKLKKSNSKTAVNLFMPEIEDIIFSSRSEAALELLNHNNEGICIDYGSTWGVPSIGMAKRGHQVISVNQTYKFLEFLKIRTQEEGLKNINLVQDDIRKVEFKNIADFAIIDGVLERIPEKFIHYLDQKLNYHDRSNIQSSDNPLQNPRDMQVSFLKKVYKSLKKEGQLLLTIDNRFSYKYFIGQPDLYTNLRFVTFLPRIFSNIISLMFRKKNYRNFTYSFSELKDLLGEAGFDIIEDYCCFPTYRSPSIILPNTKIGINQYENYEDKNIITWTQKFIFKYFEIILMKYMQLKNLCPSIVIIAKK